MKLPVLRTSSLALAASLLSISALLSGCALESTAPSVAPKVSLGKISGIVHGGRQGVAGANVYVYSPSTTGYGGVNIAATGQLSSPSNASTPLLTSSVPSSCGAGGSATATAGTITTDPLSGGITSIAVTMQGAGYTGAGGTALPPTVKITDPTGTGAVAVATLNQYNGLASIAVTSPGQGYSAPVVTITPASTNPCIDSAGNYYVSSDANGNFSLTGDYSCTTGLPVYIYTTGGDAGGGTTGGAANFMSILGICGATSGPGVFGASTFVNVNELTTVAMAYSTAGYATDPTHIGVLIQQTAPATLVSSLASLQNLELTGITNAFLTASNLYTATTGNADSALVTTPNGNGSVPYKELNTLGNILANCVNSQGVSNICQTLASYTGGASNISASAIYIAQHPGGNTTGTVAKVFGLLAGNGQAYQPVLTAAPNDWTVSIIYTGGGLSTGTAYIEPKMVTADASGNIWTLGLATPWTLSGFNSLGVPLATSGYTNACMSYLGSIVPDATSQNLWIAPEINAADTAYSTQLCKYNIASNSWTTITPMNGTATVLNDPDDLGFDGSGNLWVTNSQGTSLVELNSAGAFVATETNATYNTTYYTLAVEPGTGGVWQAGTNTSTSKKYASLFSTADVFVTDVVTDYYLTSSIAIDGSGNAWAAGDATGLTKIPAAGGTTALYAYKTGYSAPASISHAIDGGGNVWVADLANGYLQEFNNSGTLISGTYGYQPNEGTLTPFIAPNKPTTGFIKPDYIAVDGSGNVWFKPAQNTTLQEMIGAATPVTTPLSYATTNSLLGQEP